MCACDSSRDGPENRNRFCIQYGHLRCQSGVCPCDGVKYLSERGLRNGNRRLRKMDCRASQRMEVDRCRYFDISSDAFCAFTISDQTYFEDHDTPSPRTAQMECRALRHTIRHLTKSAKFFEAFCLFITFCQAYLRCARRSSVAATAMGGHICKSTVRTDAYTNAHFV